MTLSDCDEFTEFNKYDIYDLLKFTNDYEMKYRDNLNFPDNVTFGVEIETVGMATNKLSKILQTNGKWSVVPDKSMKIAGAEVVSPILLDRPYDWKEIFDVCRQLHGLNITVNYDTAGHIHIGANCILNEDVNKLRRLLKVWNAYENIIYRFSAGKWSCLRTGAIHKYAKPMAYDYISKVQKKDFDYLGYEELIELAYFRRYSGLNLENIYIWNKAKNCGTYLEELIRNKKVNLKDTLEVRTPNATIDPIIWQNNVNFFVKLFLAAANGKFDDEKLDYIIKNMKFSFHYNGERLINQTYENYEKIDFDKALELVDIIFNNNLDKITFLKQYIGLLNNVSDSKKVLKMKKL